MKTLINSLIVIYLITGKPVFSIPPNSHVVGTNWQCNTGYKKQGQQCNKIYVPPNAILRGNSWVCQSGFKRFGNQCNRSNVVSNSGITLKTAETLYDAGNYAKAMEQYRALANKGNREAQFLLGVLYQLGDKVTKVNPSLSFKWYEKAAHNGHTEAQIELGSAYSNGVGVLKNEKKYFYWIGKAANQGSSEAQETLGHLYVGGIGTLKDLNQGFRWYLKAAYQGEAGAQFFVAKYYCFGIGNVTQNFYNCSKWAKKSYDNGYAEASKLWEEYDLWKYQ